MLETKESDVLESFQEGGLQEDGSIILETKIGCFMKKEMRFRSEILNEYIGYT